MHSTEWEETTVINNLPLDEALDIIYDAMCFGFEFKVEDGKLFLREIW